MDDISMLIRDTRETFFQPTFPSIAVFLCFVLQNCMTLYQDGAKAKKKAPGGNSRGPLLTNSFQLSSRPHPGCLRPLVAYGLTESHAVSFTQVVHVNIFQRILMKIDISFIC